MPVEPHRERRSGLIWRALACALFVASSCAAAGASEYEVKAAYLLNFTKFVDWPSSAFDGPNSPMTICVLGRDPFGRALDEIVQGETVNGRRLEVRRIAQPPEPRACQVIFLSQTNGDAAKLLGSIGPGVLTVGEGDAFLRDGGVVAFVIEDRRVRFDINRTAAEAAELKLSARLLRVARSVQGGRP